MITIWGNWNSEVTVWAQSSAYILTLAGESLFAHIQIGLRGVSASDHGDCKTITIRDLHRVGTHHIVHNCIVSSYLVSYRFSGLAMLKLYELYFQHGQLYVGQVTWFRAR